MKMNTPPRDDEFEEIDEDSILEVIDLQDFINEGEEIDEEDDDDEILDDDSMMIEEEIEEMSTIVFRKHTGSVFCCSVSTKDPIAASGGEDDKAYVWIIDTGEILFECDGHKDSVTQVSFSHDGGMLATGDMAGHIQVWKISTKLKVWEFDTSDLNWLRWHTSSNVLFAGCDDGELWMWLIPQGITKPLPNYGISADAAALMQDGKRLAVGYSNGHIRIFDLKNGSMLHCISDSLAHTSAITSISTHKDNNLVMTGSLDGCGKITNTNTGKIIATFSCDLKSDRDEQEGNSQFDDCSVEVVSFCPTVPNIAVTATISGIITIWDISSQTSRNSIVQGCGISSIMWHPQKSIFFAACLDGVLRSYDALAGELLKCYTGHSNSILDGVITQGGSQCITSSDDNTVRVFNVNIPT